MYFRSPKDTEKLSWTKHSIEKMKYYGLSEQRVKRVLRHPHRTEEGIAPVTIAMMQRAGSKKRPYEIWTMFAILKSGKKRIISAWRYPGTSPKGKEIPIPDEIRNEVEREIKKIKKQNA
jgi:hypothetical protein